MPRGQGDSLGVKQGSREMEVTQADCGKPSQRAFFLNCPSQEDRSMETPGLGGSWPHRVPKARTRPK